jgi:hypothetical protein
MWERLLRLNRFGRSSLSIRFLKAIVKVSKIIICQILLFCKVVKVVRSCLILRILGFVVAPIVEIGIYIT